jgi:hypothetical protein
MPISAGDLSYLGKTSLDAYMRKTVVDQIPASGPHRTQACRFPALRPSKHQTLALRLLKLTTASY